jgi:hypothetical protein
VGLYTNRRVDRDTGEQVEKDKVQLYGALPLPEEDGTRVGLIDLTVPDARPYDALKGKEVEVQIGFFAPAKGTVITYVPKGARPKPITNPPAA